MLIANSVADCFDLWHLLCILRGLPSDLSANLPLQSGRDRLDFPHYRRRLHFRGQRVLDLSDLVRGTKLMDLHRANSCTRYLIPDIKKNGLRAPEHRLVPALLGVLISPAGYFMFGWTARHAVHWIASCIGTTLFVMANFCKCKPSSRNLHAESSCVSVKPC